MKEPVYKYQIQNIIKSMDINKNMPHNKRVKECTDKELLAGYLKFRDEFHKCKEIFGDKFNILGNLLLEIWRSRE